jgi:hypothetical protein
MTMAMALTGSGISVEIEHVPGFTSAEACEIAAKSWVQRTQSKTPLADVSAVCVQIR